MKRGKLMLTVLVVLAMLFASCSSHLSESEGEGGSSSKVVNVSLGIDVEGNVQKTISTDTNLDGLTYWYCATHNWTQQRPVHGDTGGEFILIPNYSVGAAPKNLGNFTAGEWTFDVEVRKGTSVIYSGSVDYTLYTGHTSPEVTVTPDGTGTGSVSITVKVPATGGANPVEHENLTVTCSAGGVTMTRSGYADGLATYTGTKTGLTPGAYTFTFRYTDEGNAITEGAAQAVTVFAGQTSNITGTIDGGTWHSSEITINAPGITDFTLATAAGATSVAPSTPLTITASAKSAQGNPLKFMWCIRGTDEAPVNGVAPTPPAENYTYGYSFQQGTCGMYVVTCAAIDETAGVTESLSLYVEVGYKVTFTAGTNGTVGYGANSGASTIFKAGDIVSMSVTPNDGYHVGALSPAGEYDDATHTATFYMPAANTNFEVTFEADAP